MLRNALAVIAGYLVMTATVIMLTIPLALSFGQPLDPQAVKTVPTVAYLLLNLASSFFAAMLGGWVTARIGSRRMGLVLSGTVLLLGTLYAMQSQSSVSPHWYLIVLPIIGAIGVMTGSHLRAIKPN